MKKISAVLTCAAIALLLSGCEKDPLALEADPQFTHVGGSCGLSHATMFPTTVISPDPLLVLSPPANVTATWTFNRPIADALKAHNVLSELTLVGPGLNTTATSLGAVSNGDRTIEINFSGAAVGAALNTHLERAAPGDRERRGIRGGEDHPELRVGVSRFREAEEMMCRFATLGVMTVLPMGLCHP